MINLTPDSFYAGSRATVAEAVRRAELMFREGASVIDVGAESTRPGAQEVSAETQLQVLEPFLAGVQSALGPAVLRKVSVDTRSLSVMQKVAERGVGFINDVSGGSDAIYNLVAETGIGYVLMHTQGTPQVMQAAPHYADVVREVESFLLERSARLEEIGAKKSQIIWDTGIGFGKNLDHNLTLLAAHPRFAGHGYRIFVGVSRKSFIGKILDEPNPEDRLIGTLAAQSYLTLRGQGCDILRVHDVKEMAMSIKIFRALAEHEL